MAHRYDKRGVFCVLVGLGVALLVGAPPEGRAHGQELALAQELATAPTIGHPSRSNTEAIEEIAPKKAYDLLEQLQQRRGEPLPGYVGGREFQNRERRLPKGRYREYDVNPKIRGRSRDAERLVIEQKTGRAYYSGDHYRTFVPLN
jgi:guanyl-specific ribonuclease Sa